MYNIEQIKNCIDSETICDLLKLDPNKGEIVQSGKTTFILCPDHDDTNAGSCKLTDSGYYCYRCNGHGSMIDLYAKKKNISFSKAVYALGSFLKLESTNEKYEPSPLTDYDATVLGIKNLSIFRRLWATNKDAYHFALNKLIERRVEQLENLKKITYRSNPDFKKLGICDSKILYKIQNRIDEFLIRLRGLKNV